MNRTANSGIRYFPPKVEKQQRISSRKLTINIDLLTSLVKELDFCIDKAVERYFRDILEKIKILLEKQCDGKDLFI